MERETVTVNIKGVEYRYSPETISLAEQFDDIAARGHAAIANELDRRIMAEYNREALWRDWQRGAPSSP